MVGKVFVFILMLEGSNGCRRRVPPGWGSCSLPVCTLSMLEGPNACRRRVLPGWGRFFNVHIMPISNVYRGEGGFQCL